MLSYLPQTLHRSAYQKISKQPKFEVSSSTNKNLTPKCNYQKVWKILLCFCMFSSQLNTFYMATKRFEIAFFFRYIIFSKIYYLNGNQKRARGIKPPNSKSCFPNFFPQIQLKKKTNSYSSETFFFFSFCKFAKKQIFVDSGFVIRCLVV